MSSVLLPVRWICHLEGNKIELKEILLKTSSQKIQHFCYYVFFKLFICLMLLLFMLCTFVLLFFRHSQWKRSKKRVCCSSDFIIRISFMLSRLYNPKTLSNILAGDVSPKVRPVSGVWMHFLTVLNVEHILFDCN